MSVKLRQRAVEAVKILVLAASMGWTAVAISGSSQAKPPQSGAGKSIAFVENKTYQTECTACHIGYLPGFLPARSWTKMMDDLENHFGENASLDDEPRQEIHDFLVAHAADQKSSTRRSKKIADLIPKDDAPLRITETAFWQRRHGSVRAWVWKRPAVESRAKCNACHRDAEKGIFDEHDVQVPK